MSAEEIEARETLREIIQTQAPIAKTANVNDIIAKARKKASE